VPLQLLQGGAHHRTAHETGGVEACLSQHNTHILEIHQGTAGSEKVQQLFSVRKDNTVPIPYRLRKNRKKECCGSGCFSRIPDPIFFHPGSASKNLNILTQKMVSKLQDI